MILDRRSALAATAARLIKALAGWGFTLDEVADIALSDSLRHVTRIEELIERLEVRREKLQREIRAHRAIGLSSLASKTKEVVEDAIVAESSNEKGRICKRN